MTLYDDDDDDVRKHSNFQTSLENPSIQTHLVLLCCIKRLCIFGPKGAIQICYYYYDDDAVDSDRNCFNSALFLVLYLVWFEFDEQCGWFATFRYRHL